MAKWVSTTVEIRTAGAMRWLRYVAAPVAALFGARIGRRVALWGAWRLVKWRMPSGLNREWQRFPRDMHEDQIRGLFR